AARGVDLAQLVGEPADPSGAPVIVAMPAEDAVHLLDQLERQLRVVRVARGLRETEEVADGEGICPQVALLRTVSDETGSRGELHHQPDRFFGASSHGSARPWHRG